MNKIIIAFLLTLVLSCGQTKQSLLALNKGHVLNTTHKNNIGKIAFMSDGITLDGFTDKDFINELTLSTRSDFGLRMFLAHTLTFYLSQLNPSLSTKELCAAGNFQFTFLVDGKKLYENNIPTGAGSCDYKNSATTYGVPLVNKNNPDHWGRFLWIKFQKLGGGEMAFLEGQHLLKIEVRPYLKEQELKIGKIIAQGEVYLKHEEIKVEESQIAIQKLKPTAKWKLSHASYNKDLIRQLNKKIAQNHFKDISSIVVIKEGELLIEEYFNGATRNTLHDMRSVSKTLTSSVLGVAIKEGFIKNENQTLTDFYQLSHYKNHSNKKEQVTLKSLLTMSSGIEGSDMNQNSIGNEENMYPTDDWVKFALDLPMDVNKDIGKNWDYFTAGVVLLGDILDKTVPGGLEKYANKKLFKPLGINKYKWQYTPTHVANTAGGFQMNSLDNARWGQLYLDNGRYQNKQIIPKPWLNTSLSKQIALPDLHNEYYGYLFWNKTYNIQENKIEAYYANGNGGNKIVILKDITTVIVLTATAYNQPYAHLQANEIIEQYVLPSLIGSSMIVEPVN